MGLEGAPGCVSRAGWGRVSINFEINFRTFVGPQFCMLGIVTRFKPRSHFERVRVPLVAIPPPYDVLRALAPKI